MSRRIETTIPQPIFSQEEIQAAQEGYKDLCTRLNRDMDTELSLEKIRRYKATLTNTPQQPGLPITPELGMAPSYARLKKAALNPGAPLFQDAEIERTAKELGQALTEVNSPHYIEGKTNIVVDILKEAAPNSHTLRLSDIVDPVMPKGIALAPGSIPKRLTEPRRQGLLGNIVRKLGANLVEMIKDRDDLGEPVVETPGDKKIDIKVGWNKQGNTEVWLNRSNVHED